MAKVIPYISFAQLKSDSMLIEEVPALQLGIQFYRVPDLAIPFEQRGKLRYRLLRIGSTFGRNSFSIKEGRVDIRLKSALNGAVVHDLYPRREEKVDEAELELGLNFDLTWGPAKVTPSIKYKTKVQRINTFLSAGGLLDSHAWWRFSPRKGENHIEGSMETMLTVQSRHDEKISGHAELQGQFTGWTSGKKNIKFDFPL